MRSKFDYIKLYERIRKKYGTPENFAQVIGFTPIMLANKLDGAVDFAQSEIDKISAFLEIRDSEITEHFFKEK